MRLAVPRLFSILALIAAGVPAPSQSPLVTLTPAIVEAGSPELVRIQSLNPAATRVEGEWLGRPITFSRGPQNSWYALAGADVEAPPGPSILKITASSPGHAISLDTEVQVRAARYTTGTLTVSPKFVEPGPEALQQIDADIKLKEKAFAESAGTPLWKGNFIPPVKAQPTDSFGRRRTFNGKLASIHKGEDFRAAAGTPVHAGNSGTVILAQSLYYEGNCVMIDHGLGLMSISMHLSRIDVMPGQQLSRGQQIGLSGATGRVTGPHLHWAIRWQGAYLDPARLLRLSLESAR